MIDQEKFDLISLNFGQHASWAIWDKKPADTQVIGKDLTCLNTSVVLVALNISRPIRIQWQNFHGSDHARKLMYAFNESPYRGAYMTDLIKGEVDAKSQNLRARISKGEVDVAQHVKNFQKEMNDVGVKEDAVFIVFGQYAGQIFNSHFAGTYTNCVICPHYSKRGTDADWVDEIWTILEGHSSEFVRSDLMNDSLQKLKEKQKPIIRTP